MKKTVSVSLGKRIFILEEEAYSALSGYLSTFKVETIRGGNLSANEVMEDLEMRIADLLTEGLAGREVVDESMVDKVIRRIGLPGGGSYAPRNEAPLEQNAPKKLFRDKTNGSFGGVCSGIAYYFDVDVTIIRVAFVLAAILGLAGLWAYLIFWIIIPEARTAAEKCEMRGWAPTPENLNKFQ